MGVSPLFLSCFHGLKIATGKGILIRYDKGASIDALFLLINSLIDNAL